jgi:hypothetical protein
LKNGPFSLKKRALSLKSRLFLSENGLFFSESEAKTSERGVIFRVFGLDLIENGADTKVAGFSCMMIRVYFRLGESYGDTCLPAGVGSGGGRVCGGGFAGAAG